MPHLHACLRASLRKATGSGESVATQYRAGRNADGLPLEGDLREYLKSTYLRPLRDAEREYALGGGRGSPEFSARCLPAMATQTMPAQPNQPATLRDTMNYG